MATLPYRSTSLKIHSYLWTYASRDFSFANPQQKSTRTNSRRPWRNGWMIFLSPMLIPTNTTKQRKSSLLTAHFPPSSYVALTTSTMSTPTEIKSEPLWPTSCWVSVVSLCPLHYIVTNIMLGFCGVSLSVITKPRGNRTNNSCHTASFMAMIQPTKRPSVTQLSFSINTS